MIETVVQRPRWDRGDAASSIEPLISREWLVTNGLGGYASGTLSGIMTRKYGGGEASMRMAVIAAKRAKEAQEKAKGGSAAAPSPPADVSAGAKDVPPPP